MASSHPTNQTSQAGPAPENGHAPNAVDVEGGFDLIAWYPGYQSCQRYFINHAQHNGMVQNVASFINIRLPFQWEKPIINLAAPNVPPNHIGPSAGSSSSSSSFFTSAHSYIPRQTPASASPQPALPFVSLIPYIRRLIVTGFDNDAVMHGFFGDDWKAGVSSLREIERRNYMFAAKSVGWAKVKYQYDMPPDETVPYMRPLQQVQLAEIQKAEKNWSEWLAMEDWMVGPRAPPDDGSRPVTAASDYRDFRHRDHHRDDLMHDQ